MSLARVLLLACGATSVFSKWGHVRIGQPLVELRDYSLASYDAARRSSLKLPNATAEKPQGLRAIQDSMAQAVATNGLRLIEETRDNGDCGPDAILRNLERLRLSQCPEAERLLRLLATQGRDKALNALRLMLLIWVRDNRATEAIPGVSVEQWIEMEGFVSFEEYGATMRQPRAWFDTPMFVAASSVFSMQIVCFVEGSEPQLIIAPEFAATSSDLPVALIANTCNVHFYGCEPAEDSDAAAGAPEDDLLLGVIAKEKSRPSERSDMPMDVEAVSEEQCARNVHIGPPEGGDMLELCKAIRTWDPFSIPDAHITDYIRRVETGKSSAGANASFEMLRWRDCLKLVQWEELETSAGVDREHEYRVALKFYTQGSLANGRHKQYSKQRKIAAKLCLQNVLAAIKQPCEKHGKVHHCLDPFRAAPSAVLRWRKLWYTLPKKDREHRLFNLFKSALSNHTAQCHGDPTAFLMKFKFFGEKVCRDAFIALTGIHADTLQKARRAATTGALPLDLGYGPWLGKKSMKYMNARAWLLSYAKSHGDTSPLCDKIYLPAGRREFFYAVYYADRTVKEHPAEHVASESYFLAMWRTELPWIVLRSPQGPFTHCGLCDYMKMLISSTEDKQMKHLLTMRLGEHYDFQSAQRVAISNIFAESERAPDELFACSWDKMDQAKTMVPRVKSLANTNFLKTGSRIVVSLIGCYAPAIWKRPLFYTIFEDMQQGGDMIGSLMLDVVLEATAVLKTMPKKLVFQANNTVKETKNTIVLAAAVWLLANLEHSRLQSIEFVYLLVGHTHDIIDAIFAFVGKAIHGRDSLSILELFQLMQRNMKSPPMWKHLRDVYAFKEYRPRHLTADNVKGLSIPHHVQLFWAKGGTINLRCKRWVTSPEWSPPLVVCSREQVRELRSLSIPSFDPEWDEKFEKSSLTWMDKLKHLLQQSSRDISGILHCEQLLRHELPAFLPSGDTVQDKINKLRTYAWPASTSSTPAITPDVIQNVQLAARGAFRGSSGARSNLVTILVVLDRVVRHVAVVGVSIVPPQAEQVTRGR